MVKMSFFKKCHWMFVSVIFSATLFPVQCATKLDVLMYYYCKYNSQTYCKHDGQIICFTHTHTHGWPEGMSQGVRDGKGVGGRQVVRQNLKLPVVVCVCVCVCVCSSLMMWNDTSNNNINLHVFIFQVCISIFLREFQCKRTPSIRL